MIMKGFSRIINTHFVLLSCLLCMACQPDSGDLVPVLQDGAKIVSAQSKADNALQYDNEDFSLEVSGNWESLHGDLDITVVLSNRSPNKITGNFNKAATANSFNDNIQVLSVENRYLDVSNRVIENKIVEVDSNQTKIINVGIGEKNRDYKGKKKYRGNEFSMTIPVNVEKNNGSTTTDYNFRFKYADYQPESSNNNQSLIN